MNGLRVTLFGELRIERAGCVIACPASKAAELLCYLLVHRDRAHSRDRLAEVLWPGEAEPASRRYLRQALWRLNAALAGPGAGGEATVVLAGSGWLRANLAAVDWLDLASVEAARAATRDVAGSTLSPEQVADIEDAVGLSRPDLLAAWYQDWCGFERSRLREAHLAMREQLMAHYEARREYTRGIQHGLAVLDEDPARETTHLALMRLRYADGDRTGAIRQFHACASALEAELRIAPSSATTALHQQIRADRVGDHPVWLLQRPEPRPGEPDWLDLIANRLTEIQAALTALQRMVGRAGAASLRAAAERDAGKPA